MAVPGLSAAMAKFAAPAASSGGGGLFDALSAGLSFGSKGLELFTAGKSAFGSSPSAKPFGFVDAFNTNTPSFNISAAETTPGLFTLGFDAKGAGFTGRDARRAGFFDDLGGLQDRVAPAFGDLTKSTITTINNLKAAALGDAKDSLARRKVAGSSFGNADIQRLQLGFAELENQERAKAILGEIQATSELIRQQTDLISTQVQEELAELQIATSTMTAITSGLQTASNAGQRLAALEAAERGKSVATIADILDFNPTSGSGSSGGLIRRSNPLAKALESALSAYTSPVTFGGFDIPHNIPSAIRMIAERLDPSLRPGKGTIAPAGIEPGGGQFTGGPHFGGGFQEGDPFNA